MRRQRLVAALAGLACSATLVGAQAQGSAYTNNPVNVMAGPADDYPVVAQLDANVTVSVLGCLDTYDWCDVALGDLHGWVYAGWLSYLYEGNIVPLLGYSVVIGVPVVVFTIDSYWGHYYRGRPWYKDRDHWRNAPHAGGSPGYAQPHQIVPAQGRLWPYATAAAPAHARVYHVVPPPGGARPAPGYAHTPMQGERPMSVQGARVGSQPLPQSQSLHSESNARTTGH